MESTDLLERYLQAVRKLLPRRRQDDIIAELRANLESQREEREADLGRPLSEGEMIDWLKELGPPLEVAGRYQAPRYLIGPGIFPLYLKILRLAVLAASGVYAISILAHVLLGSNYGPDWVAGQIFDYPALLITVAAWVTGVFAVLEFVARNYPEKCPNLIAGSAHWSPNSLPPLEKEVPAGGKPRSYVTAVTELIVQFLVVVWMLLIPRYPFLVMGPGAAFLEHSPVRMVQIEVYWFWALVAFNMVQLVWQGANLMTGNWRVRGPVQHLAYKAMGIIPTLILLGAPGHIYFEANPGETTALPAGLDLTSLNHDLYLAVVVISCITLAQLGWDLWKYGASARRRAAADGSPLPLV
ncbi:hypothetical protein DYQ86_07485 [Acidobacteria bacterium AB60]|nr:hypothetical protein DYQ86_07485 [Acidobacteria bacterium AB60]